MKICMKTSQQRSVFQGMTEVKLRQGGRKVRRLGKSSGFHRKGHTHSIKGPRDSFETVEDYIDMYK